MSRAPSPDIRARLVSAARRLFARDGYQGATVRAVAAAGGVTTGALFVHFADKAALYRAVYGHDPMTPEDGRRWRDTALRALGRDPEVRA
ncbi:MAG: helix-turn-helix domain containing protein [Caulobacteraceae bacterium]|nr:helix-turn-helix domain containing protein [Caulobacteraceae bacterium]